MQSEDLLFSSVLSMVAAPDLPYALTIAEAAKLACRSGSWIRAHRTFGGLVAEEIAGKQAVTTESLLALLQTPDPTRKPVRKRLRLVVDNDP